MRSKSREINAEKSKSPQNKIIDRLGSMLTPKQDDELDDFSARLNDYSKKKTMGEREKIIYKKQGPSNWQKFKK